MEDSAGWFCRTLCVLVLGSMMFGQGTNSTSTPMIRLVNGGVEYGRLEIYHNGEWGTVCDDSFDNIDAQVACRELGLDSSVVNHYDAAYFGEGFGSIWLDDVECSGYESFLVNCSNNGFGIHDCSHSEDVGISCGITDAVPTPTGSGSSYSFNPGSWVGFAVVFLFIAIGISLWRRRRLHMMQRAHQRTTTTTTIIQPTAVPANNPNSAAMPTYYHNAPTGGTPAQPQPPSAGGYPKQPAPNAGYAYPPPQPTGGPAPGTTPYAAQPYPPPAQQPHPPQPGMGGAAPYPPPQQAGMGGATPYPPPQQAGMGDATPYPPPQQASMGGAAPYPPPQSGDAPPMYPQQAAPGAPPMENLPPPPAYNDVVKE